MFDGATMAMAKKAAVNKRAVSSQLVTRALKMRPEYAKWLESFAARERINLSSLIDRALSAHAQQTGFDAPPARTP
jgi:predicted DNA-binding ribbon-helix-helix protein